MKSRDDGNIKILHLNTNTGGGGAAIAAKRLHEALLESKQNSAILTADFNVFSKNELYTEFLKKSKFLLQTLLFKRKLKKNAPSYFSYNILGTQSLVKEIKRRNPDVIHLHWINHGFMSNRQLIKISRLKIPMVWTCHDMWPVTGGCHHSCGCLNFLDSCGNCFLLKNPHAKDHSYKQLTRKMEMDRNSLHFIGPSSWMFNQINKSSLGRGSTTTRQIPNAINTRIFKPIELKTSGSFRVLGFVSANPHSPYKGIKILHQILQDNKSLLKNCELLIVGNPSGLEFFYDLGLKVTFTGFVEKESDLVTFYNKMDVFLLPSVQENLPNTIVEAMSCGVPVVAFNTGGIADLVSSYTGYLASLNDEKDFARGIQECLKNNNLGMQARDFIVNNFSYPVIAEKHITLYKELKA